jgi:hypothetical protein
MANSESIGQIVNRTLTITVRTDDGRVVLDRDDALKLRDFLNQHYPDSTPVGLEVAVADHALDLQAPRDPV